MDRNTVFGTVPDLMASVEYVMWNTLQFSFFKYTAPFLFFSLSLYPFWRCALLFVKLATRSVEKITKIVFFSYMRGIRYENWPIAWGSTRYVIQQGTLCYIFSNAFASKLYFRGFLLLITRHTLFTLNRRNIQFVILYKHDGNLTDATQRDEPSTGREQTHAVMS